MECCLSGINNASSALEGRGKNRSLNDCKNDPDRFCGCVLPSRYATASLDAVHDVLFQILHRNYSKPSGLYHWQYRDDEGPIFSEEWQLMIHCALWPELSLHKRQDAVSNKIALEREAYIGKRVGITVKSIGDSYASVIVHLENNNEEGVIYKSDVSTQYVNDIGDYLWVGEETDAAVKDYDVSKMKWILTRKE